MATGYSSFGLAPPIPVAPEGEGLGRRGRRHLVDADRSPDLGPRARRAQAHLRRLVRDDDDGATAHRRTIERLRLRRGRERSRAVDHAVARRRRERVRRAEHGDSVDEVRSRAARQHRLRGGRRAESGARRLARCRSVDVPVDSRRDGARCRASVSRGAGEGNGRSRRRSAADFNDYLTPAKMRRRGRRSTRSVRSRTFASPARASVAGWRWRRCCSTPERRTRARSCIGRPMERSQEFLHLEKLIMRSIRILASDSSLVAASAPPRAASAQGLHLRRHGGDHRRCVGRSTRTGELRVSAGAPVDDRRRARGDSGRARSRRDGVRRSATRTATASRCLIDRFPNDIPITIVRSFPRPLGMMEGIDSSFAAVIFIGYHASTSSTTGVRAHTMSSALLTRIAINGTSMSEAGINAAIAAQYGVPVVMITGDDADRRRDEAATRSDRGRGGETRDRLPLGRDDDAGGRPGADSAARQDGRRRVAPRCVRTP